MSRRWNHTLISLVLLFATSCATLHVPGPRLFGPSKHNAATTRIPRKGELPGLVGRVQQVRVSRGDTLLDIARGADVGYQQVQDANPKVDAWVPVAGIYGGDRSGRGLGDPEAERLRFQRGDAMVCVFTVTASISLHAGELLPDGRPASEIPRVGLFHQPRFSGIQARQVTGRTHRDGRTSPWRIAFAEDTVEEQVARVMVERLAVSGSAAGADTSSLQEIAELLDADWLPAAALSDA